jgi:hypothetical protein
MDRIKPKIWMAIDNSIYIKKEKMQKEGKEGKEEDSFRNQLTFIVHNASLLKPGWK